MDNLKQKEQVMSRSQNKSELANLVHEKSVEILSEVGFCIPESQVLVRLEASGFPVDHETQMVKITPELLSEALKNLAALGKSASSRIS